MTTNAFCLSACLWQFCVYSCCLQQKKRIEGKWATDGKGQIATDRCIEHWNTAHRPKKTLHALHNFVQRICYFDMNTKSIQNVTWFLLLFLDAFSKAKEEPEKKWKRGGKRRRNANWLSPAMWCLWSWSLSFSLWMESILKSDLNETTTNQKLNVCFHNDQPIFTRERERVHSVSVFCAAVVHQIWIYVYI